MRRAILTVSLLALLGLGGAAPAQAAFSLKDLDLTFENADGSLAPQAGAHPFALTTKVAFNTRPSPTLGFEVPDENPRDVVIAQMPGLVGDPTVVPPCTGAQFLAKECPVAAQIGVADVSFDEPGNTERNAVYSLAPPPGVAMTLGWHVSAASVPVTIDLRLNQSPPYNVIATLTNIPNVLPVYDSIVSLWGVPASPAHDSERFGCGAGGCVATTNEEPFLTTPRACTGPLPTTFNATSWEGSADTETILTHDESVPPAPLGMIGCGELSPFEASIAAQPTARAASSPSGMDVTLAIEDEGFSEPEVRAQSDVREVVVTLPEGMTANPSVAEGLGVCSESQLAHESPFSEPGAGCPQASKIGTVEVQTPLLDETLRGSLYQAEPHDNLAGDSLIALYIVIKSARLGIVVKQPLRVEPDPRTGRLQGIATEVPQLPFSRFEVRFREGARSPLISPPDCGTHTVRAEITPWSGGTLTTTSSFEVTAGPEGRPCPPRTPPFAPGFEAGTLNNAAGSYSPFLMRWTRRDGDQDIVRFSAKLPPGAVARLAGTAQCPQPLIEAAKHRTGLRERANPSCPASSRIGNVLTGAGVGSQLTYVPGTVYLAGPYRGAPLSAVGIVPAVAGPFDVGTVVVQQALRVDPVTAEVSADGASSDPVPHILAGIPLKVRDIRVAVDKPSFTLNPTSCAPSQVGAWLWGGGVDPFRTADDFPVALARRFQAAGCASLDFGSRLKLLLKGKTRRAGNPALRAVLRPRPGEANLRRAVVLFPRATFLDQGHIRTVCTRVQFAARVCPPGSVYGRVRAFSPLLDEPLEGPVYLRSSDNLLPDIVFDLKGIVDVEAAARADSVRGRLRVTFPAIPDAPLSRVVVQMQGGRKGLLVNSRDICAPRPRALARLAAHNGRRQTLRPVMRAAGCGEKGKRGAHRRRR